MSKNRSMFGGEWFFTFIRKSLVMRKGRVAIAAVSVTLAVTVITAMAVITVGISKKLGDELKAYGANIIVSPLVAGSLDEEDIGKIMKIDHVVNVSGQILTQAFIRDRTVEVIGLDISSLKNKGWRLSGKWPEKKTEALAGINLMEAFGLSEGETLAVRSQAGKKEYVITGFIEKGGFEDSAIIMSLQDARYLTEEKDALSALLVRGDPEDLEGVVDDIQRMLSGVSVKTFRQVAVAEQSLLEKIRLLMSLVTVVILLASGISVAGTMGADVLERREEIGLMKAIGATRRQIGGFFLIETVLIGMSGGILGCIFGYFAAQIISQGAFDSFISFSLFLPPLSLITGLVLAVLAGYFPVRDAMKYNPAEVLRGE
jgi:putative ABC transport system permease protein